MERSAHIDRQTLSIFWRVGSSRQHRGLLLRWLLYPVGVLLMSVAVPLYIGKTLGALALPSGDPMRYFIIFVAVAAAGTLCNRLGHPAVMRHEALTLRRVQEIALVALLRRSVGFHNNNIGGKLVSDAIDYPSAYGRMYDALVASLLPLCIGLGVGSVIIYTESWPLGLFVTCITVLIVGMGAYDSYRRMPNRRVRMQVGKDVTAHLADTITNIQTAKTFAREDHELQQHALLGDRLLGIRIQDWRVMSLMGNTRMMILAALQAGLIFTIIRLVQANPALLGVGIFAFSFTVTLSGKLFEVNALIRSIEESFLQAAPMTQIIQETPEIQDVRGAKKLIVQGGAVTFRNVTFAYADANQDDVIFNDLTITVAPGEKVGLVGPSGGGKTTFTRLLLRFDDITAGAITIDGQNIAAITQESLRKSIAYVPQEPLLFHRTIHENIAYGKAGASLRAVKNAAKLAHADEFIGRLSGGYKTVVGERGVKLSGGQRQRIAIARAILKDAPILVLDEATSALDSESEVLIQDALWRLMKDRTAIVVAHRLSTIQKMDRIVVLDDGKIVEQGTHQALLKRHGLYAKLWSHQSGGFLEADK